MRSPKEPVNITKLKCRRTLFGGGAIMTSNYSTRINKSGKFEFLAIETDDRQNPSKRSGEEDTYRRHNFRTLKAIIRAGEESRKTNDSDCMNMMGLDIRKVNWKVTTRRSEQQPPKSPNSRYSLNTSTNVTRGASPQAKSNTKSYIERNNTSLTLSHQGSALANMEFVEGVVFSTNYSRDSSSSPQRKMKRYLYEKMANQPICVKMQENLVYEKRIKSYIQLIWKVNLAHNIYVDMNLSLQESSKVKKLKVFVGPGNNSIMIKSLIKRRFWWTITDDRNAEDLAFFWTQIKNNQIYSSQPKSSPNKPELVNDEEFGETKDFSKASNKFRRTSSRQIRKGSQRSQLFNSKLMNETDVHIYSKYRNRHEKEAIRPYEFRKQKLGKILKEPQTKSLTTPIHNHLQNNFYLGNKKALFHNLKQYCQLANQNLHDYIPLTFHIKRGAKDPQYKRFIHFYQRRKALIKKEQHGDEEDGSLKKRKTRNIWIVKPGENSNRGKGITVIDEIYELNQIMKSTQGEMDRTYIVQMYIDRPFLYYGRKFDIRHFLLITNFHGITRAYWYEEGYMRTSSYEFSIFEFQPEIHLTNDAIQKTYPGYGKFQPSNKLSYAQFQRYLDANFKERKLNFSTILSKMKKIATDAVRSVYTKISPGNLMHNFEILGMDFMIDRNFKPWLLEINTNPCLQVNCPLLDRVIPYMVEQSLKLTIDVVHPPPSHYPNNLKHLAPLVELESFKYQLVFDSQTEGDQLTAIYQKAKGNLIDQIGEISEDQVFKDDGKEIKLDDFS